MKRMKYLIVDPIDGTWNWYKDEEHHSLATPKVLNSLDLRTNKLLKDIAANIRTGMSIGISRSSFPLDKKIKDTQDELRLHVHMLNKFKQRVSGNVSTEEDESPIIMLKSMDSPLRKNKQTVSLSHIYERFNNTEVIEKIDKSREELEHSTKILDITKECWNDMLQINQEIDAVKLLDEMRRININLRKIDIEDIYSAFFYIDDATRGLLSKKILIKVKLSDAANKLLDLIQRALLKFSCVANVSTIALPVSDINVSDNKEATVSLNKPYKQEAIIEKAFERLRELKIDNVGDMNIQVLWEIKMLLETEPQKASLETCYKKIGEMHANIRQKLFEMKSLSYLRNYLSEELIFLIDVTMKELENIYINFCNCKCSIIFDKDKTLNSRNLAELEVYATVIEELLLDVEPGKVYFALATKLRQINQLIANKYHVFDKARLIKCIEVIGSDPFFNFISSCEILMFELRNTVNNNRNNTHINPQDLIKIGLVTGKTTMIKSYSTAIEEILALLGTFMGNTLHNLVKEMLINIPTSSEDSYLRTHLKRLYRQTETSLREFNQETK